MRHNRNVAHYGHFKDNCFVNYADFTYRLNYAEADLLPDFYGWALDQARAKAFKRPQPYGGMTLAKLLQHHRKNIHRFLELIANDP